MNCQIQINKHKINDKIEFVNSVLKKVGLLKFAPYFKLNEYKSSLNQNVYYHHKDVANTSNNEVNILIREFKWQNENSISNQKWEKNKINIFVDGLLLNFFVVNLLFSSFKELILCLNLLFSCNFSNILGFFVLLHCIKLIKFFNGFYQV